MFLDADERASSNSRFSSRRKTRQSRRNDTAHDHALPAGPPITQVSGASRLLEPHRVQGVDPLWCWAHIRRYFIRAGDAHVQLRTWRDQWVTRIADLYVAHRAMAAATAGSAPHTQARQAFDQALTTIDTVRREQAAIYSLHPAAKKVLATLDREWDGVGWPGPPP